MDYFSEGLAKAVELLLALDPETFSAVWATAAVTALALAASLVMGLPLGFALGHFRFPGRRVARLVVDWMLSLPTVVIGLIVYALFTTRGPLGEWGLLFTLPGMAIGLTLLGLPIIIAMTATAVESTDVRLTQTVLSLGADRMQLLAATLSEARFAMALAAASAFGRIVSEVGIAMMVGGNIKWHTRTITTAIALETGKGEFASGIALGIVLMLVALVVNLIVGLLRSRSAEGLRGRA
ncbi:MAG TPA: ABC transporter permease [Humidesulfovibrio sp.]|uniref:ABC transporter permease n=1 Tax=Humidesulfovibrio sp. TaxID=2910988 RepID=UPI002B81DABE|nr:ABC transporter permease [Humidesulfovibrio sp.]HWR02599.1 ABC transporter permease [Humidesulfovibrio sp.]